MNTLSKLDTISRLPEQILVQYGPRETLGAYFLALDRAVRERGISLSLQTDFSVLKALNKQHQASWGPFNPLFDPDCNGINAANAFWILGVDAAGDVVLTQAARHYDWRQTSLAAELVSLRLFFDDRSIQRLPGERFLIGGETADTIRGHVVFSGGLWIRPDYRGRDLPRLLPRLSRALALTRWDADYTISLVRTALIERGIAERYGYSRVEPGYVWENSSYGGALEFFLISMPRAELLADMASFARQVEAPRAAAASQGERNVDVRQQ